MLSFSPIKAQEFYSHTISETKKLSYAFSSNVKLISLYFGGGTPTYLLKFYPDFFRKLIHILKPFLTPKTEITCETNLEEISPEVLSVLKNSSINRLSIGFQTDILRLRKLIGRYEKLEIKKLQLIPRYFSNWSLDIIYGIPTQTTDDLEKTLTQVFKIAPPPHISAYLLEIKENTPLAKKKLPPITDEEAISHYQFLSSFLKQKNYIHYEVSNFALPHFFSHHNLAYWQEKNYLALGPRASGKIENIRYYLDENFNYHFQIEDYKTSLLTYVIMRLRTKCGLNLKLLQKRFNLPEKNWITEKLDWFRKIGFGKKEGDRFFFEEKDWLVLNSLLSEFFS